MKRLLAGFLLLGLAMVLSVGNTGCTKKSETKDKVVEKEKKASGEMTAKPAAETPKSVPEPPTPVPLPIPLPPKEEPKKPELPKIDPPKDDPKKSDVPKLDPPKDEPKKGATLDRPLRPSREAAPDAAFERLTASS
jgi:outer membrane biosynthesis protein TonB